MIKVLEIVDGRSRKAKPCALLFYDTDKSEYSIEIKEGVSVDDVPMMLEPFVERGQLKLDAYWSRRWVEERVPPPGRQNLGEILRAHDLTEYDDFTLLCNNRGECSQDYFVVRLLGSAAEGLQQEGEGEGKGAGKGTGEGAGKGTGEGAGKGATPGKPFGVTEDSASGRRLRTRKRIGASLAAARKKANLKQHELARRAGVDQAVISRIETGRANATLDLLSDIAAAMDLDVADLFVR